ncbi:MAG: NifU family protein [Bacteroidales bacterium]|nr:NifU family protein [Bacteroidales bacterium]
MTAAEKKEITRKVNAAIGIIRPYLVADGGDVTLVEITDDLVVKVRLLGACNGCPFSLMTLKAGIEQAIRKELPELKELVAVN